MNTTPVYLFSTSSHPDAISINSLDIEILKPKIDFLQYDYLIITSKQTSNVLKQYDITSYKEKKALCISQKSAESFEEIGGQVLQIGAGYGDTLVDLIYKYSKEIRWLYLRAETVASNFAQLSRENGYKVDEVVVYKSKCSLEMATFDLKENATLIFTSPSSVECFLKYKRFSTNHRVIVIGKSTANALPLDVIYTLSKERSIQSCIDISEKI